jgi:predicted dinucleotide-binding enzyme
VSATSAAQLRGTSYAAASPSSWPRRTNRTREALAQQLEPLARSNSVDHAIATADVVVFATIKELISKHGGLLENKVVVDPSNPIGFDESGQMIRTLPEGVSSGSVVAGLLARARTT